MDDKLDVRETHSPQGGPLGSRDFIDPADADNPIKAKPLHQIAIDKHTGDRLQQEPPKQQPPK